MANNKTNSSPNGIITFIQILIIITIAVVIFGSIVLAYQAGQAKMWNDIQKFVAAEQQKTTENK